MIPIVGLSDSGTAVMAGLLFSGIFQAQQARGQQSSRSYEAQP